MAKKEFTYKGKTLEELKMLSDKEFARLIPAKERRTMTRGYTEMQQRFIKKVHSGKNNIKTQTRDVVITPIMVGKTILIHSGKEYVSTIIQPEMVGHRLGEFSQSRRKVSHSAPGIGATKSSSSVSVR